MNEFSDKCQNCKHFYECDNMGTYEECLPNGKLFEPKEDLNCLTEKLK